MNSINRYLSLLKKAGCLFLLFVSACQSFQSPTPSLSTTQTVLPTVANFIPTATGISGMATDDQPVVDLTPLPKSEDYIIYNIFETNTDYKIWAINPKKPTPIFLTANFTPRSLSPSNRLWLFTAYRSIYVANADGSEIHLVYTYKEYQGIEPFWLTDDVILFNAYKDTSLPPDMYSLDINSGIVTPLFPGSSNFIQAAFPSEKKWLRASWPTGSLDIVDQNGKTEKFFDDFSIITDAWSPYPPIQRINGLDTYLITAKGKGDSEYKLWLVSNYKNPKMLFDPGNGGLNYYLVSPNEQYLALTYVTSEDTYLYIFDLKSQQLVYQWSCPYKTGACNFIWSPDSRSIALQYSDFTVGTSNGVMSGIQTMDIMTGKTRIILNENVTEILDWYSLK